MTLCTNPVEATYEFCNQFTVRYYKLISEIIKVYDIEAKEENLEPRYKVICQITQIHEIIDMLQSSDADNNNCSLNFIESAINKNLFKLFFGELSIEITHNIMELFDEASLMTKKRALTCLTALLNFNFDFYSDSILNDFPTSLLTDFIESEDIDYQTKALLFIDTVFTKDTTNIFYCDHNDFSPSKNFAFYLNDDNELINALLSFECSSSCPNLNEAIYALSRKIVNKISFYVDDLNIE